jgi:hypothetical protein
MDIQITQIALHSYELSGQRLSCQHCRSNIPRNKQPKNTRTLYSFCLTLPRKKSSRCLKFSPEYLKTITIPLGVGDDGPWRPPVSAVSIMLDPNGDMVSC